jgi:DNA-binding MarR family transcriptional regulator
MNKSRSTSIEIPNGQGMSGAFAEWVDLSDGKTAGFDFREYMHTVAQARYVVRKVLRIVHEQAKRAGIDPLDHQALVQLFGAEASDALSINRLAERLDIPPALASRVTKRLAERRLIYRRQSESDKRVTEVNLTEEGVALLKEIDREVHIHISYFREQLTDDERLSLMAIFAFWAGLGGDSRIGGAIRTALAGRRLDNRENGRRRPTARRPSASS